MVVPKTSQAEWGGLLWYHVWTAILSLNLVAPLYFAQQMTGGGRVGITMAIGLLWLIGALAGSRSRRVRSSLQVGGGLVALSQFLPILQIVAGMVSLKLVIRAQALQQDQMGAVEDLTEFGGFLATILTGGSLILIAWAVGATIRWFAEFGRPREEPTTLT